MHREKVQLTKNKPREGVEMGKGDFKNEKRSLMRLYVHISMQYIYMHIYLF